MPEFVNTGKGMQLIETNNAFQVPFQQGNLIIEDSGSIYYDPTNKTDVSGRITVGKADEIIDLGTISSNPNISNAALKEYRAVGIYKYKFNDSGLGNVAELLIVAAPESVGLPFYQYRITATNGILYRSFVASAGPGEWKEFAKSEDIPTVINNLSSSSTSSALSANQGRILDGKISEVATDLTAHENKNATTAQRGHVQLVNNLTSGGTDKALTAEQGKQLKSALDSIELVEELGAVTSPLTSANTFEDVTTPGIYNFTSNGEVGYLIVGGQNNGAQTTQYMLFDNNFYSRESTSASSWSAWNKCLQAADIVNNLTSGGTDVPLSAEQGKQLNTTKANKATTLAGYGITNAYTKTEIDTKLSSVYRYIGSVTVEQLPQNLTASDKGNVYNLTNDGTINASTAHEETVVAGDNVAWTGDYWDKLAGTINIPEGSMIQFITSGSANDINDEGLYYVNGTVSNLPDSSVSTGKWFLICATSSSGSSQTAYSPTGYTYHRIKSGAMGSWESWQDITFYKSNTGDVTIGGKVNTTGTRDAGNVVIGSGATTTGDNGVVIGSAAEVTGANNKNSIAIGYEAVSAANGAIQIGHGTNSTANTTQIGEYPLLDATGKIIEDRLPEISSKKYSTIVIGNSASGLTANDVDYLYEAGSDFGTILSSAISKLTGSGAKGGEIKILSGTYTLNSAVTTSGTYTAAIKITGEGKSTIITSSTPTDYYINASYCEISECRLDTDIRVVNDNVNIHDCEVAERIYFNNDVIIQNIFIHDNNLDYTPAGEDFLYLSGSGILYNLQVYNNYCYTLTSFDFLHAAAPKNIYCSSIRNNHCPYGTWSSSTYDLDSINTLCRKSTITGNTFYTINFSGSYWCISNNLIVYDLFLYDGDYLDVMNNRVDGTFTAASGLTYANITGNVIDRIATTSPYVNLGTNARFVNNTIRETAFNTTYLPGYDTTSNKWGNNMWANGIDRLVFANGEEIGEGQ